MAVDCRRRITGKKQVVKAGYRMAAGQERGAEANKPT